MNKEIDMMGLLGPNQSLVGVARDTPGTRHGARQAGLVMDVYPGDSLASDLPDLTRPLLRLRSLRRVEVLVLAGEGPAARAEVLILEQASLDDALFVEDTSNPGDRLPIDAKFLPDNEGFHLFFLAEGDLGESEERLRSHALTWHRSTRLPCLMWLVGYDQRDTPVARHVWATTRQEVNDLEQMGYEPVWMDPMGTSFRSRHSVEGLTPYMAEFLGEVYPDGPMPSVFSIDKENARTWHPELGWSFAQGKPVMLHSEPATWVFWAESRKGAVKLAQKQYNSWTNGGQE